jgi:hypothetical protein
MPADLSVAVNGQMSIISLLPVRVQRSRFKHRAGGTDTVSNDPESPERTTPERNFLHDPQWFPEGYDPRRGEFQFVVTCRDALASQPFLDSRWHRNDALHRSAAVARESLPLGKPRLNFIWHTGFCCSTLLAKALDHPGQNLSLCEPQVLVEIAHAKRAGAPGSPEVITASAFSLLSRGFSANELVTVKPAPAANCLIREAAALTSGAMLFLYADCRSFLVSVAKLGEDGRKYVRRLFLAILGDGHEQARWRPEKILSLSDLELAAIVWHMQIAEMLRHWQAIGPARAASLDCDAFLADPVLALRKADAFLSLGIGTQQLSEVAAGPLFQRNAKTAEASYDANRRREEHSRVELALGEDLSRIVRESYALCRSTPNRPPLPNPLIAADS